MKRKYYHAVYLVICEDAIQVTTATVSFNGKLTETTVGGMERDMRQRLDKVVSVNLLNLIRLKRPSFPTTDTKPHATT